eukprot:767235-Hanusia_phi.AAC.3
MADKVLILNCPFATVVRGVLRQGKACGSSTLSAQACCAGHERRVRTDSRQSCRERSGPVWLVKLEGLNVPEQYHACLFGGALPEGLEGGEDEMEKWAKRGSLQCSEDGTVYMTLDNR